MERQRIRAFCVDPVGLPPAIFPGSRPTPGLRPMQTFATENSDKKGTS